MNATQTHIVELFDRLGGDEQRELALHLYQRAQPSFLARMTPEQRAELEAGLAEADRREGTAEDEVFRRLEQRLGVKLARRSSTRRAPRLTSPATSRTGSSALARGSQSAPSID